MRTGGYCGDFMGEVRLVEPELLSASAPVGAVLTFSGGRFAMGYPLGMPVGVDGSVSFQVYLDGELVEVAVKPVAVLSVGDVLQHHIEVIGISAHLAQMSQANVLSHIGGRRVQLSWPASESDDVSAYRVYDNGGSGAVDYETVVEEVAGAPGGVKLETLSWLSSLLADGTWRFAVRAVDEAGNVAEGPVCESGEVSIAGLPLPVSDVGFEYESSSAAVELTWVGSSSFS